MQRTTSQGNDNILPKNHLGNKFCNGYRSIPGIYRQEPQRTKQNNTELLANHYQSTLRNFNAESRC